MGQSGDGEGGKVKSEGILVMFCFPRNKTGNRELDCDMNMVFKLLVHNYIFYTPATLKFALMWHIVGKQRFIDSTDANHLKIQSQQQLQSMPLSDRQ